MNLSAPFILRPVMTTLLLFTFIIAGLLAYFKLAVSDLPTIEPAHIEVTAHYAGASPDTMLHLVTMPLEKELIQIKGLKEISSKSTQGHSFISLDFDLEKNIEQAAKEIETALHLAKDKLPSDMESAPRYHLQKEGSEPIIYLILTSSQSNQEELQHYADRSILPRLNRIPGVANISPFSSQSAIWLKLNPELMAIRQVGFNQVAQAVQQYTMQTPLGSLQTAARHLPLETKKQTTSLEELRNLKILHGEVRLAEIATISDQPEEKQKFRLMKQGRSAEAFILAIQKVNDGNTVTIAQQVEKTLDALKQELPPSIQFDLWFNKAVWIEESIQDVKWSLAIAFVLVIIVIYLSLGRFLEAFLISVALPLSIIGTATVMYLLGYSLNLLSLLALTLSVGFVVDDAIVVLENIVRYQELGMGRLEASLKGSKQICFTIFSMTLSLVAVFIPLLFMPGMEGRLFREFSVTLAVSILLSGLISLTVTPMLCSRFLPQHHQTTPLQQWINGANAKLVNWYAKSLAFSFKYAKTVLFVSFTCVAIALPLFTKLSIDLIPSEDRGFLFASVEIPTGLAQSEVDHYQEKLEAILTNNSSIESFLSISFKDRLVFAIRLKNISQRPLQPLVVKQIQTAFNQVAGTQTFIHSYRLINLNLDLAQGGSYRYVLRGPNFKELEKAAEKVTTALQNLPEVTFARHSLNRSSPKLVISLNRPLIHRLGLMEEQVRQLLQQAYHQTSVGFLQKKGRKVDIYMQLLPEYKQKVKSLENLYLTSGEGTLIPFKALASWKEELGEPVLYQREQLPAATIYFSLDESLSQSDTLKKIELTAKKALAFHLFGFLDGSAKAITETMQKTLLLLLAAALVMYVVLGILYESFIHPFTILSSLPFAGVGGVITLYLFDEPLSIFSAVGFLLLIGIVKKNGIMMIDYALQAQQKGAKAKEAIYEGCLIRFRPIMMTTITAIMGAVPLAIGFGDSAKMRQGLGLVIIGGLLFSQALTLYVTPLLYLLFEKIRFSFFKEKEKS